MIRSIVRSNASFSDAQVTSPSSSMLQIAWNFGTGAPSGASESAVLRQPGLQDPEQVVDAVIERERVALEVEEQVPRARFRQHEQAAVGDRGPVLVPVERQQLPQDLIAILGRDLDPGLLADPLERGRADAVERRCHRQLEAGESAAGRDAACLEGAARTAARPGDEAQVVVVAPADAAHRAPAADVAVLDRLRVGAGGRVGDRRRGVAAQADGRLELRLHAPVVGHVVVDPELVRGALAPAEDDVQVLGLPALDGRQLLDVGADLEDRRRLDVAGELGVGDLVVPRPQRGVRLTGGVAAAEEEVGVAAPGPVEERRLVHDVRAAAHRGDRLLGRGAQLGTGVARRRLADGLERRDGRPVLVDLDDPEPRLAEVLEVPLLVLDAALRDEVDGGIVADRLADEAREGRALELEPVVAGEEPDEIGRGVDGASVDQLHARPSYGPGVPARVSRAGVRRPRQQPQAGRSDLQRPTAHCQSSGLANATRIAAPLPVTAVNPSSTATSRPEVASVVTLA